MDNWNHICVAYYLTFIKWNIFSWGYRKKSHGWWGWHSKPPTLCPLLYFLPALSAYINRMARRLMGNTGKCPVGGIVTPGGRCGCGQCMGLLWPRYRRMFNLPRTLWVFPFPFYFIRGNGDMHSLPRPIQHSPFVLDELSRQSDLIT